MLSHDHFSIGNRHLGDGGVAEFHYSKKYKLAIDIYIYNHQRRVSIIILYYYCGSAEIGFYFLTDFYSPLPHNLYKYIA